MPETRSLLIVDDDEAIRTQMRWAFSPDYEVFLAQSREEALEVVRREGPPVVTLDLGLPPSPHDPSEGFAALAEILEVAPATKVIVITGQEDRENALRAVADGAHDFYSKPIQVEELRVVVGRARRMFELEQENRELQKRAEAGHFEEMLGSSAAMQKVFTAIRKVATTDTAVLVTGETGTGKELVARAIHRESHRSNGPFVAINCGAIPANLLEAELFGHEKGAFTDAHMQRKGRIEMAQGGTLFLDEIGELPANLQVALLRYLQEHQVQRVGGRQDIEIDARVIAATNQDIPTAIREGRFREDLYYRLGVVKIELPPLRDREDDVLLLATSMLRRFADGGGKRITGFTRRAVAAIGSYAWPGNVRELENRVRRALIMADGQKIDAADLELDASFSRYAGQGLKEARAALEREMIERSLGRHRGNLTQVAAELGISRPTLYELMEKLGIKRG